MYLFTCESVSPGHPDKCADIIADTIVERAIGLDPNAKVATEVFVVGKHVIIGGEVKIDAEIDEDFYIECAKDALRFIGYPEAGFSSEETVYPDELGYEVYVSRQSPDIAQGVEKEEIGAGDQGMMIGFATDEYRNFMPAAIMMAREVRDILYHHAKEHPNRYGVDIKTEIVLDYGDRDSFEQGVFKRVDKVIAAQSHVASLTQEEVREEIEELIKTKASFKDLIDDKTEFIINGTGKFVIHSFIADSGLTGRKIAVDNYGAYAPIGGGTQSTKDYTKVDRSAHYAARWLAKHIVAAKLAKKAQVELSYVIGRARPLNVTVNTFGTGVLRDERLSQILAERFPLTPKWIRDRFSLHQPKKRGFSYVDAAAFGQVGMEGFPWEELDELEWFASLK